LPETLSLAAFLPLNGAMLSRLRPNWTTKDRPTLRVAALSGLCFVVVAACLLVAADRAARARTGVAADVAARELELQRNKQEWVGGRVPAFPDLDTIATPLLTPGLCVGYRQMGEILQRICAGRPSGEDDAPPSFAALYRLLFDPGRPAASAVKVQGRILGEALAWADPAGVVAQAWRETGPPLAVTLLAMVLVCVTVHAAFAERGALTRKLIALQDEERRALARELHDEFGQCLAAIRALAASAGLTAAERCPDLLPEYDAIARAAARMSESLRGALFRLRPPDVIELGLGAALQGLVAGWNGPGRGGPRFEIELDGAIEEVTAGLADALYRIAQEALTNCAKHAEATRVALRVRLLNGEIELTVDDDGNARDRRRAKAGMGLLGMRERVAALGGRLSFEAGRQAGSVLRVAIPLAPAVERQP
jgi:signal transduction histidine kinase